MKKRILSNEPHFDTVEEVCEYYNIPIDEDLQRIIFLLKNFVNTMVLQNGVK